MFDTLFGYPFGMDIEKGISGLYLKKGCFYYRAPMVNGKRPTAIALKTKDRVEAVNKLFELMNKKALGPQSRDRMDALVVEYLAAKRAERTHSLRSSDNTRKVLERLSKDRGNPRVSTITRKMVVDWRAALGKRQGNGWGDVDHAVGKDGEIQKPTLSEASISSYLQRLRGFLTWLVEEKHLREHPMELIRLPRVKKTKREKFCTTARAVAHCNSPSTHPRTFEGTTKYPWRMRKAAASNKPNPGWGVVWR